MVAIMTKDALVVEMLLLHGADHSIMTQNLDALQLACHLNLPVMVELLLHHGADAQSALSTASAFSCEIVQLLQEHAKNSGSSSQINGSDGDDAQSIESDDDIDVLSELDETEIRAFAPLEIEDTVVPTKKEESSAASSNRQKPKRVAKRIVKDRRMTKTPTKELVKNNKYEAFKQFFNAIETGQLAVVKNFINARLNFNVTDQVIRHDSCGLTPLMIASEKNHEKIVFLLLSKGANVHAKDSYGRTALHFAVEGHDNPKIAELLIKAGIGINVKDGEQETALRNAAALGRIEMVKILLQKKAHLNREDWFGNTPLLKAVKSGHQEIVRLLLEAGADTDAHDGLWRTALIEATYLDRPDIVKLLINYGANSTPTDLKGNTALDIAIKKGNMQIIDLLK